ncbi:hypothetical protein AB0D97_30040 [Streptomyces roseus]|uniref:hypothetical protein n=1 Tax=Streptomyces roseus TaxID=66430 RepID=UPI0033D6D43F
MSAPPKSGPGSRLRVRQVSRRTQRSQTTAVLILPVLLLTAAYLGLFGIEDLDEALTFVGRITGAGLIVASAAALLGSAAVVDHWFWKIFPYSGMVALIGTVAALLTNTMVLFEILNSDSLFYKVLFGLLTAGSAWAVFAVWRTLTKIPAPKRVATAVIVSSVFAIANFGYQNLYLPSLHGARPAIKLTMGEPELSMDGKSFAVPVNITLENRSEVGFYVLGAEFHAMGQKVEVIAHDRLREKWRRDAQKWKEYQDRSPLSRREEHQPGELLAAQPWMAPGGYIEASDSFTTRMLVRLPVDTRYDQMAFYATASLARKDRLGLDSIGFRNYSWSDATVPQWVKRQKELDSLIYIGRVHQNNSIDERTMTPRSYPFTGHSASTAQKCPHPSQKRAKKIVNYAKRKPAR